VLPSVGWTVPGVGETDRNGIVSVFPPPGVLEGFAGDAEQPCARRRQVWRDIV